MGKDIILTGGYINDVHLQEGCRVAKHFIGDNLTGIPSDQRMNRERLALLHFGGRLAPSLLGLADVSLYQQYIHGMTYEELIQENPTNLALVASAGKLLSQIHTPINRPFDYLKADIEHKVNKYSMKALPVTKSYLKKEPRVNINWDKVKKFETTRVHRDLWLGNIINGYAIDWEFSGIGSPYEDFAIAELWIFMVYGGKNEFYNAYGESPDTDTVLQFLKLKCLQFLSTTTPASIESEGSDGFYRNKISILEELES